MSASHRWHDISNQVWERLKSLLPGGEGKVGRPASNNRLEEVMDDPDFEWLIIDASHIKVHPHAAGAPGGNQEMVRTRGDSIPNCTWQWTLMACRSG
jgi:hypothetical protein